MKGNVLLRIGYILLITFVLSGCVTTRPSSASGYIAEYDPDKSKVGSDSLEISNGSTIRQGRVEIRCGKSKRSPFQGYAFNIEDSPDEMPMAATGFVIKYCQRHGLSIQKDAGYRVMMEVYSSEESITGPISDLTQGGKKTQQLVIPWMSKEVEASYVAEYERIEMPALAKLKQKDRALRVKERENAEAMEENRKKGAQIFSKDWKSKAYKSIKVHQHKSGTIVSDDLGMATWIDARGKCANLGMQLPSRQDWEELLKNGVLYVVKNNHMNGYWSSTHSQTEFDQRHSAILGSDKAYAIGANGQLIPAGKYGETSGWGVICFQK